jgi:uncharacterized membrane protein YdjX (TVP38/TMEM64 family)
MINSNPSKSNLVKFSIFIVFILLFLCLGKFFSFDKDVTTGFLSGFSPALSGIIFIILYVVITFLVWLGPKDIFRIAAAIIYGAVWSTVLVFIGEMINVVVLFHLSRKLGRGFVELKLRGGMRRVDQAIADSSFWAIFFMRFFPIIPFRFLDLGFGLTKISLKKYFLISFLASPLRIFILQLILSLGADILTDPGRLSQYLIEHPRLFAFCFIYVAGSFVLAFIFKKRQQKV